MVRNIVLGLSAILLAAVAWLSIAPPDLLRVGDGYAAKIVCSNVFLAHRGAKSILAEDVQAPGNPVLKLISVRVEKTIVTARMLGLFAAGRAVYREGYGCTSLPDKAIPTPVQPAAAIPSAVPWAEAPAPAIAQHLANPALTGPGMRAVVVIRDGKIVGETYAQGFDAATPLLGWSMTKTVNAAVIGRAIKEGKLGLDDAALLPAWQDNRRDIRLRDLLAMQSGLEFNEDYGDVSDVVRMLYLTPDMARFAANKPRKTPGVFTYSSGTAVILSRIWQDRIGANALTYPRDSLFAPLGMTSAVMEPDATGTFVGSSYLYATARDWARFGQFLLQDGVWDGKRLLPEGFVALMRTSNGSKDGYSLNQTWLPTKVDVPADTFWLNGHDGQSVAIVPSQKLVVVRMGLTPSDRGYQPEKLVAAIAAASSTTVPVRIPPKRP